MNTERTVKVSAGLKSAASWTCFLALFLVLAACSTGREIPKLPHGDVYQFARTLRDGRDFSVALYDNAGLLVNSPVEDMRAAFRRADSDEKPFTDIFVLVHGWNFTIPEAAANFSSYVEGFDARAGEVAGSGVLPEDYRPYILFVAYDSISRPTQDLAQSVLPLGLSQLVALPTYLADTVLFHIPSAWGESVHALEMGVGVGGPGEYRNLTYDQVRWHGEQMEARRRTPHGAEPSGPWDRQDASGAPLPVSVLLRALFEEQYRRLGGELDGFRIHCIGHSYGAKIISLAAMEALSSWFAYDKHSIPAIEHGRVEDDPSSVEQPAHQWGSVAKSKSERALLKPIDTLLLFNPAMHIEEFSYTAQFRESSELVGLPFETWGFIEEMVTEVDPLSNGSSGGHEAALRSIERKGVVYSNRDFANGLVFDLSEIIIDKHILQAMQAWATDAPPIDDDRNLVEKGLDGAWHGTKAAFALGGLLILSPLSWISDKLINLPSDWWHHTKNNDSFGSADDGSAPGWARPLNALHFFLPLDQVLFSGRAGDQGGITRYARSAVGQTGLYKAIVGRSWVDLGVLEGMVPEESEIGREAFNALADLRVNNANFQWDPGLFYSFDATDIYDSLNPLTAGAHGDLRSPDRVDRDVNTAGGIRSKRDYTMDFIFRAALQGK